MLRLVGHYRPFLSKSPRITPLVYLLKFPFQLRRQSDKLQMPLQIYRVSKDPPPAAEEVDEGWSQ